MGRNEPLAQTTYGSVVVFLQKDTDLSTWNRWLCYYLAYNLKHPNTRVMDKPVAVAVNNRHLSAVRDIFGDRLPLVISGRSCAVELYRQPFPPASVAVIHAVPDDRIVTDVPSSGSGDLKMSLMTELTVTPVVMPRHLSQTF